MLDKLFLPWKFLILWLVWAIILKEKKTRENHGDTLLKEKETLYNHGDTLDFKDYIIFF